MDLALKPHGSKAGALEGDVSEMGNPLAESSQVKKSMDHVEVDEQQKGKVVSPKPPPPMPPCSKTIRETREERPERKEVSEKRHRRRQQEERNGKPNYEGPDGGYGYPYQGKGGGW